MQSFSYSALSTALRCNRLYQHLYIDKMRPEEPESLNMHFGTAIHCGVNALLEGGDSSAFGVYWGSVKDLKFGPARDTWEQLADAGDIFLDRFERLHLKHLKPVLMEQRLYGFSPRGIRLEGTPDFVGEYKGEVTLVDFKTAGSAYHNDKIHCADQLLLYAYLAQQKLGITITQVAYIVFVKGKEPRIQTLTTPITQALLAERIENIELQCRDLLNKEEYSQNFEQCHAFGRKCGFWKQCHGGSDE